MPSVIQKRKPLSESARRAGWTGCNILLRNIPNEGKIYAIKDRNAIKKELVSKNIKKIDFFKTSENIDYRGWLNDILLVVSNIKKDTFTLQDTYKYCKHLKELHPQNNNIEAKIRQQLQILRDNNIIEFLGNGVYKKL